MTNISTSEITLSMRSCLEGYVREIVGSLEFSLERELTEEEQNKVFQVVEYELSKSTTNFSNAGGTLNALFDRITA